MTRYSGSLARQVTPSPSRASLSLSAPEYVIPSIQHLCTFLTSCSSSIPPSVLSLMGRVSTNIPITPEISCLFRPAKGTPITISFCPLNLRSARKKAVSKNDPGVTPALAACFFISEETASSRVTIVTAPFPVLEAAS